MSDVACDFSVYVVGYREGTRLLKREELQFVFLMMLQSSVVKLLLSKHSLFF